MKMEIEVCDFCKQPFEKKGSNAKALEAGEFYSVEHPQTKEPIATIDPIDGKISCNGCLENAIFVHFGGFGER